MFSFSLPTRPKHHASDNDSHFVANEGTDGAVSNFEPAVDHLGEEIASKREQRRLVLRRQKVNNINRNWGDDGVSLVLGACGWTHTSVKHGNTVQRRLSGNRYLIQDTADFSETVLKGLWHLSKLTMHCPAKAGEALARVVQRRHESRAGHAHIPHLLPSDTKAARKEVMAARPTTDQGTTVYNKKHNTRQRMPDLTRLPADRTIHHKDRMKGITNAGMTLDGVNPKQDYATSFDRKNRKRKFEQCDTLDPEDGAMPSDCQTLSPEDDAMLSEYQILAMKARHARLETRTSAEARRAMPDTRRPP